MINKFFFILKKIILSSLLIYTYDSFVVSNHMIPINFINISFVSAFGIIALFYLVLFSFI